MLQTTIVTKTLLNICLLVCILMNHNLHCTESLMKHLYAIVCALSLVATPLLALAQNTPEQAIAAAMQDMREHGVQALSEHMHPEDLARFHELLLPLVAPETESTTFGAVMASQGARSAFFSDASADELRTMSAARFMGLFLSTVTRNEFPALGVVVGQEQVVGRVSEGQIMHMMLRTRINVEELGVQITPMHVISLRQDAHGTWKVLVASELEGIALAFRQAFDDGRAQRPTGKKVR